MSDRDKQLIEARDVLTNLVRVIQTRRAIEQADNKPHLTFWILINNSLFDTAVLDWCKLFGSDDEERQPTHWKNVVKDHDKFRADLFAATGVTKAGWEAYWKEMKLFRDTAVAHHSSERRKIARFPRYELALQSAYFYYERIVEVMLEEFGITQEPAQLKDYSKEFFQQSVEIAAKAVAATASIREGVD